MMQAQHFEFNHRPQTRKNGSQLLIPYQVTVVLLPSNQIYLKQKNHFYLLSEIIKNLHFNEICCVVDHVDRK
jgi:hypothetical protein